jgi:3-carboxy-cis,cis-muconate cycloisomerase
LEVQTALCAELKLAVPQAPWHVARDSLAECVNFQALLTASLGKVAYDVLLLASTEIGELAEPYMPGRGGSSTMPQKRNPISSELILAAGKAVRQHAGLMLDATVQDLERATGPWHAEWIALPESFVLASGALHQAKFMLGGLQVDAARMRKNLDLTGGLIMAEAVMMGLAPTLGRGAAHDLVAAACRTTVEQGSHLADTLAAMPQVTQHLSRAQIDQLTDPLNYLGVARAIVERAVAASQAQNS